MIDLSLYKQYHASNNKSYATNGEIRKMQSDMIMEQTWYEDIQSRTCYLYDCYHDDEPLKLRGLHPEKSKYKVPIDVKYIVDSYQGMDEDQVTYHLQFKPSQECNVDYYDTVFGERYGSIFPLGLYIDIPDEKGNFNRWLIVEKANFYNPQFVTFQILPCDYIFQYIYDNKKCQIAGCLRSQNSYNSGVWGDYKITSPEDQQKIIIPLNRDTEKIYYDQRVIIDAKVLTEPRTWKVTKVNRISPSGLLRLTFAQSRFNQHTDYVEVNEFGNVIGMWADYFESAIPPNDAENVIEENNKDIPQSVRGEILYSGLKPQLKIGGSYKTFTANYYNSDDILIEYTLGDWKFTIDGTEIDLSKDSPIEIIKPDVDNNLLQNQIKIKFSGSDDYLGKILTVSNTSLNTIASIDVEIIGI